MAATVHDKSGALQTIPADLSQPESFDAIVSAVLGRFGKIDVLVNNAGIGQSSIKPDQRRNPLRFWEVAPEQWQRFLAVNATGPIMMSRAVVPHMLRAGKGRVITVTTSLGTMVRGGYLLYGASKAAAEAAMAVLAADLQGQRRHLQRAGARRCDQHAAGRRGRGRSRADAATGDHGAAAAVAGLGRRGRGDGAAVRGDGLGCVAARRAGGGEGRRVDSVAVDCANAGGAGVSLLSERSGQGKAQYWRRALRRCR